MKQQLLAHISQNHPWRELVQYLDQTDSTNDRVKALAKDGAPHGTTVMGGRQTAGKGRLGRSFDSPADSGVYMSFLLRLPCPPDNLMHLTCAAAVAACDAVQMVSDIRPGIKWTNDLVLGGKKLGGILTELVTAKDGTCAIVGIGINCRQSPEDFPPEIAGMACSLAMNGAKNISPAAVAGALMESMEAVSCDLMTGKEELLCRYKKDCITLGKDVRFLLGDTPVCGKAVDIDPDGALLVSLANGQVETVRFGEVSVRGLYGYV